MLATALNGREGRVTRCSMFFVHQKASASDYRSRGREFEPMPVT